MSGEGGGSRNQLYGADPQGDDEEDGGLPWLEPVEDDMAGGLFPTRVLIGIGAVFVLLFGVFIWYFYTSFSNSDVERVTEVAPELIEAPQEPYKVKPADPQGMDIPDQDKYVLESAEGAPAENSAKLAPPAEQPVPRDGGGGFAEKPAADKTAESPAQDTPAAATDDTETAKAETPAAEATRAPQSADAAKPAETEKAAAATGRPYVLQLGAFSSEQQALKGWNIYAGKYPDQLSDLAPDLERVTIAGKLFVRLRASGFAARSDADKRCAALKTAGQPCLVVERK